MTIDQTVSDFDGVLFHISTPETKSKIVLSIQIRCFKDLVRYGAEQVLHREYGDYVIAPEAGFDFSVLIDLENLPSEQGKAPPCPRPGPSDPHAAVSRLQLTAQQRPAKPSS
ncbi:hypothetical protein IMZ48_00640 [Candidatus Bathyarchaeota archaeon]|nr:hypothetical protein [Candidatus Bathyarchaeota archaeon]